MSEKIKIIKNEIEVTIECKPNSLEYSLSPTETIKYREYLNPSPEIRIPRKKFSISGEMESITLTKKKKGKRKK